MPQPARKTPARKTVKTVEPPVPTDPAEAAAAEVSDDENVRFDWRDVRFVVPRSTFSTVTWLFALKSGRDHEVLYETFNDAQRAVFLDTLKPGELIEDIAREFNDVLGKAAGWGNSDSSG